jgi:uncharacterized protein YbaA (DUF1428 family)
MAYVDCWIMPVPKDRIDDYRALAEKSAAIWKEMGALSVTETLAEDAPVGTLTSFPRSVQMKDDETVVLSFLTYRDRAHRDDVMKRAMADARMSAMMEGMPVDGKRLIWGGFEVLVAL